MPPVTMREVFVTFLSARLNFEKHLFMIWLSEPGKRERSPKRRKKEKSNRDS